MTPATQAIAPYALSRDVFVCLCGRDFVLLDLVRDKYLALEAAHAAGLSALVRGWPATVRTPAVENHSAELDSLARALLARGVLTMDPSAGKDATPLALPTPRAALNADSIDEIPTARAGELASFLSACVRGKFLRRRRTIEQIVTRMKRRKEQAGSRPATLDLARAQRLIAVFDSMRSLFFSTRNLCVLESIVLLELFARYGLYPSWVFGVHVRPFAAHCWLQYDEVVLNDTVEHVNHYTPIMMI